MESQTKTLRESTYRILFVCLGNICRSPAAEGILAHWLQDPKVSGQWGYGVVVDSAGTGGWHAGELADPRMRQAAERRGYPLGHRARQITLSDFDNFDFLFTMDGTIYRDVQGLTEDEALRIKVKCFGELLGNPSIAIPDPYYGGPKGFEEVLDLIEKGLENLPQFLKKEGAR